jgi:hypothetical protein
MIVRKGDTVLVQLNAALPYFANPVADQIGTLRGRLQAAGFQVVAINAPAFTDALVQNHSYYQIVVSVKPVGSDYGDPADVASIVAGATQAAGLTVDFNSVSGRIVQSAAPGSTPPTYGEVQTQGSGRGFLDDLADALGVSKGTLTVGGLAIAAVFAIKMFK